MRSLLLLLPALTVASAGLAGCSGGGGSGGTGEAGGDGGAGGSDTSSGGSTSSRGGGAASGSTSASDASATASSGSATGSSATGGVGGASCVDTGLGEPDNDSEATAHRITGSCEDDEVGKIYGVLDGPGDVDWYVYTGEDKFNCKVNPTHGIEADAGKLRVCVFAECIEADVEVSCPTGAQPEASPGGRSGCCATSTFELGLNCKGTTADDANIFIRIDDPTGEATCPSYTASYHY